MDDERATLRGGLLPRVQDAAAVAVASPVAWLVALAVAGITFLVFQDLRHDDAFITLQYARNLGRGNGYVFNPGEPVFGATSPLAVLILAGVYRLAGDVLAPAAVLIGSAALAAQALLIYLLLRVTSLPLALLAGALVALGMAGAHEWLALETNLEAALVLGVVWALVSRRTVLCGVLLGAAILCRYDALLLAPLCALAAWQRDRAVPTRLLAVTALVAAPWFLWAHFYFGSFMPQTFFAKKHLVQPVEYATIVLQRFALAPWAWLPESSRQPLAYLTPALWVSGLVFVLRHARPLLLFCVYGIGLLVAYALIGPHPEQGWHQYLPGLTLSLLGVLGTAGWLAVSCRDARGGWSRPRCLLFAALAALWLWMAIGHAVHFARSYRTEFWLGWRHERYVAVADWLRRHVKGNRTVLAQEVGTIGYLTEMRMIDPYGLINATNDYPSNPSLQNLAGVINQHAPAVLLLNSPRDGGRIEEQSPYRMVKVFDTDPWSTVLVRSDKVLSAPDEFEALRSQLPERARPEMR
jgi:hypothetical protein